MDEILRNACQARGWEPLYKHYIGEDAEYTPRSTGTELEFKSPFPGADDKRPSASFNVLNGMFVDFHSGGRLVGSRKNGGNLVQLIAWMRSQPDAGGRLVGDFEAAERELRLFLGISSPVDHAWYSACRMRFAEGSPFHSVYAAHKPFSAKTLVDCGVGWDDERGRMVYPIHDRHGNVINCRLHKLGASGAEPKITWLLSNVGPQNMPFPARQAWERDTPLWFVEGEADALSLNSLNIPAVSGTMGSSQPLPFMGVEGSEFVLGRHCVVCSDEDSQGEQAAGRMLAGLQPYALSLRRVRVPSWPGAPTNRDISDWIRWSYSQGDSRDEIRREILQWANDAETLGAEAAYDAEPLQTEFVDALSPETMGRRVEFVARAVSRSQSQHVVPYSMELTCREGHSYCNRCAMNGRGGRWLRTVDHRSPTALALTMADDIKYERLVKRHFDIVENCPDFRMQTLTAMDVQIAQVGPPQSTTSIDQIAADEANSRRTEAFVVRQGGQPIEPGHDYRMRGFMYAETKRQKAVLLIDRAERLDGGGQKVVLSAEDAAAMHAAFWPEGMTAMQALKHCADDVAASVTGIRMRTDMHLAFRAVWHSALSFRVGGEHVPRGWLELFVLGDTRCGKSAAFKAMSNWYGQGVLVDCKMQTVPGLLGAVEQSTVTGERYVVPGTVPLNDGRGPVGFDEFTGPKNNRSTLMEAMSSTRAEGVVRINKAAHGTFKARVRSIWMANPGDGRMLADIPGFGVERVKWLVQQPEDVARFDLAMVVAQSDVPIEVLLSATALVEPRVPMHMARALMEWSRTREEEDITWEPVALDALAAAVRRMVEKYDSSIPLVETATQRHKLAKLAVSLAFCTFSSPDGATLMVTAEHVIAAYELMVMLYDKPSFGYHAYSTRRRLESTIEDPIAVREMLEREFGDAMINSLFAMRRAPDFNDRSFRVMCGGRTDNVVGILRTLAQNRCIEPVPGGRGDSYRMTRAFVRFIDEYIHAYDARSQATATEGRNNGSDEGSSGGQVAPAA